MRGMEKRFDHQALKLTECKPLVYTAFSKHLFYYRMQISQYVLQQGKVPLNPFMAFDYFLLDTVERDVVRQANNSLVAAAEEIWCFGPVSDGVLAEIEMAKAAGKPIRYFAVQKSREIVPIDTQEAEMEEEVAHFHHRVGGP